ncbi:hypothetical protein BKA63DRAFT_296219 [Paraphoma chrysanthemicola]|nr:hypothetical protein BKA63DRAFT_296219 [Paraphoma chrysanthemicola]
MTRRKVPFMSRTRLVMTQPRPGNFVVTGWVVPSLFTHAGAQISSGHAPLHHSATVNLPPPKQRRRDCRPRTHCSDVTRAKTLLCPEIILCDTQSRKILCMTCGVLGCSATPDVPLQESRRWGRRHTRFPIRADCVRIEPSVSSAEHHVEIVECCLEQNGIIFVVKVLSSHTSQQRDADDGASALLASSCEADCCTYSSALVVVQVRTLGGRPSDMAA